MRILVVMAHDRKDSLTAQLAQHICTTLNKHNTQVDFLDLYEHKATIPFYSHDMSQLENNEFFQLTKSKVMQSDRLVVVFPVYWYAVPGILKCWFDLITNYAWHYQGPPNRYAQAHHAIKKALVIYSTMSPWWYSMLILNPAKNAVKQTLLWMGVKSVAAHGVDSVQKLTEDILKRHKEIIDKKIETLLS